MEANATARPARTADGYFLQADETFTASRQQLISYLMKLNRALNADLPDLSRALLSRFCDALLDYLSAGYFRVFQRVAMPPRAYALIEATTRAGMSFNDRFGLPQAASVSEVKEALEQLAQELSRRFELEDQLLCAEPR